MKDQIMKAINWNKSNSDSKITSPSTPAAKHLFMLNDNAEALDDHWKQAFHSIVAKLLYVAKQACPDIKPTIAFLCVENKMCLGNERKEIKPSTDNKGDSQVGEEDKEIDVMPKDS